MRLKVHNDWAKAARQDVDSSEDEETCCPLITDGYRFFFFLQTLKHDWPILP